MKDYSVKQVAAHKTPDDAWISIHGQGNAVSLHVLARKILTNIAVYDVTKYVDDHPGGGDILTEAAGTDASEAFDNAGHSEDAFDIMKAYAVGRLEGFQKQKPKLRPIDQARSLEPKQTSSLPMSLAIRLGLTSLAVVAVSYAGRRQGFTVPKWLGSLAHEEASGLGFVKGICVGGGALAIVDAVLAQRFSQGLRQEKSFTSYPAHMKVARPLPDDTLLQRGLLDPASYTTLPLKEKILVAPNVYRLTFTLPRSDSVLGLPIGQHVAIKAVIDGKNVSRSYTPVSNNWDRGILRLVIKVYPDGQLTSKFFEPLEIGDEVPFRGPKGAMQYYPGICKNIGMVAGGTGITPMFQLIRAICESDYDTTAVSLIYANRTEEDILLRTELDAYARRYPKNFKVHYMLDHPPEDWKFGTGYVTGEVMTEKLPGPAIDTKIMLCGPPGMVNASKKALVDLGFEQPGVAAKATDQIFLF